MSESVSCTPLVIINLDFDMKNQRKVIKMLTGKYAFDFFRIFCIVCSLERIIVLEERLRVQHSQTNYRVAQKSVYRKIIEFSHQNLYQMG